MEQEPLQELEVNERLEEHHSCNSKEAEMTTEESDDEEHYSSLQNEVEEQMRGIFEESSESEASCQSEDSDEEQEAPMPWAYTIVYFCVINYRLRDYIFVYILHT